MRVPATGQSRGPASTVLPLAGPRHTPHFQGGGAERHDLTLQEITFGDLALLPGNPRQGGIGADSESMRVIGAYQPIIANRGSLAGRGEVQRIAAQEPAKLTAGITRIEKGTRDSADVDMRTIETAPPTSRTGCSPMRRSGSRSSLPPRSMLASMCAV